MQRRLQSVVEQGALLLAVLSLSAASSVSTCAQSALSLTEPPGPVSTLDAQVPPQDLQLQATIVNLVDSQLWRKPQISDRETSRKIEETPAAKKTTASTTSSEQKWRRAGSSTETDSPQAKSPVTQKVEGPRLTLPADQLQKKPAGSSSDQTTSNNLRQPKTTGRTSNSTQPPQEKPRLARQTRKSPPGKSPQQSPSVATDSKSAKPSSSKSAEPSGDTKSAKKKAPATPQLKPLTRQQQNLRNKVRRVLSHYYSRPLNTERPQSLGDHARHAGV